MSLQEGDWLYNKVANRHVQTYVKGFVDVSGGDMILRNGNLNVAGRSDLSGDTVMHQNANVRGLIKQSDTIIEGGFIYKEVIDPAIQDSIDEVNAIKDSLGEFIFVDIVDPSLIYIGGAANVISIRGDASINNALSVGDTVNMDNTLLVDGDVSMNSELSVGGAVNMDSTLSIQGDVSGNVSMTSTLLIQGDVSMNSELLVEGDVSMNSKLLVEGDVSMNDKLFVSGDVNMNDGLTVNNVVSMNNRLNVVGDVSLNNELFVGGDVSMNSDVFVGGDISLNGFLNVATINSYDGAIIDGSLNCVDIVANRISAAYVDADNLIYEGADLSINSFRTNELGVGGVPYPQASLHVTGRRDISNVNTSDLSNGIAKFSDMSGVAGVVIGCIDDNSPYISDCNGSNTNSTGLRFLTQSQTRMSIDSSGNVGIGTTTPMSKLEVNGAASFTGTGAGFNSTDTIGIHLGNYGTEYPMMQLVSNNAYGGWIDFAFTDSINSSNIYDDFHGRLRYGYNNGFTFLTAATERMRIQDNGNVGIGTNSPSNKLTLKLTTNYDGFALINESDNIIGKISRDANGGGYLNLYESDGSAKVSINNNSNSYLNGGYVGIGTTSPTQKLDINGDLLVRGGKLYINSTSDFRLQHSSNNVYVDNLVSGNYYFRTSGYSTRLTILNSGNVGIGTASPTQTLDVNGNINFQQYLKTKGYNVIKNTASGTPDIYADIRVIRNTIKSDGMYIGYGNSGTSGGDLRFYANNTSERMRISASNGYVGIGTASPIVPLHVHTGGNFSAGSVRYFRWNDGGLAWGDFNNVSTSVYGRYSIGTNTHIFAHSDGRIKKDIIEINDDSSLQKIRLLKPSYYRYIDYIDKQESRIVEGFIAQEVEDVVPSAVKLTRGELPNIMLRGTIVDDNAGNKIITIPNYNTNQLELDASGNIFTKLIIYIDDDDDSHEDVAKEVNIIEILSSTEIKVETYEELPEEIFVYGQEVNNKRALIKDKIFTIGISALQEVDRQLLAEKAKTITLETKVSTLEAQLNNVLTRLSALENTN